MNDRRPTGDVIASAPPRRRDGVGLSERRRCVEDAFVLVADDVEEGVSEAVAGLFGGRLVKAQPPSEPIALLRWERFDLAE